MWYKRTLPLLLAFTMGIAAFTQFFIPHPAANEFRTEMSKWMYIIFGFAMLLGLYSLMHMHYMRIRKRQSGWAYSVFVYIGAVGMIALGLWNDGYGPLVSAPPDVKTWYQWGYENIQVPCSATIFSILAFFIASAAFRTFRARNVSAALLLIAAVTVMFGRVPVSEVVGEWFGESQLFSEASDWLMNYPNMAAKRAIVLGVSLGAISQSLRIIFGIERSYMGGGD